MRVRYPHLARADALHDLIHVDLATGKATEAAKIAGVSGTVRDIAILGM